ncbi:MAG: CRP-like cAMP-activated global transcriptional regulator [Anaerolineae bacterium]|nr:CRP-like cAMP-activated global transcriptional regulator [Anaerolineae bacterium]
MTVVDDPRSLGSIALFHNLTDSELDWLNEHLHHRTFGAGSNLAIVEQPGEVIYLILDGTLKIFTQQLDGTEVILAILGPGDTVGEMSLVDSAGRSANVVTLEKSSLLWMDRPTFQECLQTIPAITYNLVHILAKRLRLANEQIQSLATLDVYGRVARQILAFAEQYGRPANGSDTLIPIRLTQSDIGDLVGASRERINQVMVNYKRNKYISVDRRYRITVHDKTALAARCR